MMVQVLIMAAEGKFSELPPLEWDPRTSLVVVMASNGYPGELIHTHTHTHTYIYIYIYVYVYVSVC
jgi:phosphoribosylamine-glycine ligase